MPIKRGTIVEFIGTELTPDSPQYAVDYKKRILKEFFDKYGLQPGDRAKIWEGYRGSWIRITWTLQDGTTAYRVPMRSGNFKVAGHPSNNSDNGTISDLESEDDSVPELQPELAAALDARLGDARRVDCFESDGTIAPQKLIEDLRKILKQTRAENEELKAANIQNMTLYDARGQEIKDLHDLANSRADQIDGLLHELDIAKRRVEVCDYLTEENRKLQDVAWHTEVQCESQTEKIKKLEAPAEVQDGWARDQIGNLTRAMSENVIITDAQQKIIQNLKTKLDDVETKESNTNELANYVHKLLEFRTGDLMELKDKMTKAIDDKKRSDATIVLQNVAEDYLTNKRLRDEWVVPDIGSG